MKKNILITGATGKQGLALIKALTPHSADFHIYALARSASKPGAQSLASKENITVVEGDLDSKESITKVFDEVKAKDGGIWGVYVVLAYPGLGQPADGEERQGKMMADIALEYQVSCFIYSSAARQGPKEEPNLKLSQLAKSNIEHYCMSLTEKGLPWTIIRPGFFLENFDDFLGSIAVSILNVGLQKTTKIGFIASEDIGKVAAGVFQDPDQFKHQILTLYGEIATMSEIAGSYKRATSKSIPTVPSFFAWSLLKINKGAQQLIRECEMMHHARVSGDYPELEAELAAAKRASPLQTYFEYVKHSGESKQGAGEWNKLSVTKLLMGQS